MKKFTILVLAASLAACGGNNGTANLNSSASTLPASTVVIAAASPTESMDSAQFLVDAYRDGLSEIALSQTALQRASDGRVKKFAQAMIDQHTAMNTQLTSLAQSKSITLPTDLTADQNSDAARLAATSSTDFDKVYMQINVAAHEKDVAAFRQQAKQGSDADVRKLADAALPLLQLHLAAAEDINGAIDPNAFIAEAYQDGLAEIQLSQLALQKASNADVKAFAQRMIDDHTQADSKLATLAQQAGVTLPDAPTTEQQAIANELSSFSGTDFDKAYMDVNVVEHLKDISLFLHQAKGSTNDAVKSFAQQTLPTLLSHLKSAKSIDTQLQPSFPYQAYQDGKAEIRISQLALLKSSNAEVRSFAQRMIDDHSKANDQLATLADQKGIALPDELSPVQTLAFVALDSLSGQEFDRAYAAYNVRAHEKDVTEFTTQSQQASDPDIKQFAQATLPVLNDHLALAKTLRQSVGATSSSPSSSSPTSSTGATPAPQGSSQ
jgi:predicted outer membrane protein